MFVQDLFIRFYDYRPCNSVVLGKILGLITKVPRLMAILFLPFYYRLSPGLNYYKQHVGILPITEATICITSFPARISNVWLVIETLLRQTVLPSKIILYLSKLQFPNVESLPNSLKKYLENGILSVKFVDEDIRSHKKYWYAVRQIKDRPIITVDDDIIYLSTFIEKLVEASKYNKYSIPCYYWRYISRDNNNKVLPYSKWSFRRKSNEISKMSKDVFFGSGGGALFPVGSLNGADLNINELMSICPLADDLWLNATVRINKFYPLGLSYMYSVPEWSFKNKETLHAINNGKGMNDVQLQNIIRYYIETKGKDPFQV